MLHFQNLYKRVSIWNMTYVPPFGIGLLQVQAAPKTTLWFNSLLKGMTEFSKAIMVLVMVFAANGYRSKSTMGEGIGQGPGASSLQFPL